MTADLPANSALFKIGDFSRLTRVPIKTLRYYDEVGLFAPAQVDTFTGYRYLLTEGERLSLRKSLK